MHCDASIDVVYAGKHFLGICRLKSRYFGYQEMSPFSSLSPVSALRMLTFVSKTKQCRTFNTNL
jgi:hypothetical protein